jgi:hypothetical protein
LDLDAEAATPIPGLTDAVELVGNTALLRNGTIRYVGKGANGSVVSYEGPRFTHLGNGGYCGTYGSDGSFVAARGHPCGAYGFTVNNTVFRIPAEEGGAFVPVSISEFLQ